MESCRHVQPFDSKRRRKPVSNIAPCGVQSRPGGGVPNAAPVAVCKGLHELQQTVAAPAYNSNSQLNSIDIAAKR